MARDRSVNQLRYRGETGKVIVTPGQPFSRRPASKGAINRVDCEKNCALFVDVNNGSLKLFARDFGKPTRDLLKRRVVSRAAGDDAPPLNPQSRNVTFGPPVREWLWW